MTFHCGIHVGQDLSAKYLESKHDAVLIAIGSEQPFDFFAKSPGRNLDGLHYAMDFLPQQNRRNSGEPQKPKTQEISAKDKHVIVIGGGDTGSDCIRHVFPPRREERHATRNHAFAAGEREQGALPGRTGR